MKAVSGFAFFGVLPPHPLLGDGFFRAARRKYLGYIIYSGKIVYIHSFEKLCFCCLQKYLKNQIPKYFLLNCPNNGAPDRKSWGPKKL
jgi:hypothetical protein